MMARPRLDRSWVLIMILLIAWMAIGLWLGADGAFIPACDDVRPRGC